MERAVTEYRKKEKIRPEFCANMSDEANLVHVKPHFDLLRNAYFEFGNDQLEKLARENDAEALSELGYRLRFSTNNSESERGWNLTLQSALLGHPLALARCFFYGRCAPLDYLRAYELFCEGANRSNTICMHATRASRFCA